MARRRMIDPAIWQSEDFSQLSTLARLVFIGMISNADDEGRGRAKPVYLKSIIFPYDENLRPADISKTLSEISSRMSVTLYSHDGSEYYAFDNWQKWQTIDRPKASNVPPPPLANTGIEGNRRSVDDESTNNRRSVDDESPLKERKGKEKKGSEIEGFSDDEKDVVESWVAYKAERKDKYTDTGLKKLLARFRKAFDSHGIEAVRDVVDAAIASMYKGIVWDKLKPSTPTAEDIYGGRFT